MQPLCTRDAGNPSLHRPLATYIDDLQLDLEEEDDKDDIDEDVQPFAYRARGRIGRGGRLVIDRVPLRRGSVGVYLCPSMLSISPKPGYLLPPVAPPVNSSFSTQARSREKEIFSISDSEDERIELGSVAAKRSRSVDEEIKYHLNI